MSLEIEYRLERISKRNLPEKPTVELVVCETISVVREVTSKEYFQTVDVNKITKASNELKKRAGLVMSRTFNSIGS